jgi:ribonuclease HI
MICVDASCSKNPGPVNYRGKDMEQGGRIVFDVALPHGTNNIGEFLAVVHALAYCKQHGITRDIYSDSQTALAWVRDAECRTTLKEHEDPIIYQKVIQKIRDAENFLRTQRPPNKVLKWDTVKNGEIPADYGRK